MSNFIQDGRIGKFGLLHMGLDVWDSEKLLTVFGNFVIVRAESLYAQECIEYTAYSPLFDIVDRGEQIPRYEIVTDVDGKVVARRDV